MLLAERLERDEHIALSVQGTLAETDWRLKRTAEGSVLGVTYRVVASDVTHAG